jgi:Bacterial HORMA domain family 1
MMTASATATRDVTFTITDARYVGAKVGADLRLLNILYGRPGLDSITEFAEEAALLLRDRYLGTVDYGFRDAAANSWKLRLRYTATTGGHLLDDRPGKLPTGAAVAGYPFFSYLTYSAAFDALTAAQQDAVRDVLPVHRVGADEPVTGLGASQSGHGYGRNGTGVTRDLYIAIGIEES